MLRRIGLVVLMARIASCKPASRGRRRAVPSGAAVRSATAPPPSASASSAEPASAARAARSSPPIAIAGDLCRVTRGPVQLAYTGQVAILIEEGAAEPRFVFDVDGVARAVTLPSSPPKPAAKKPSEPQKPERLALSEPAERTPLPACAAASGFLFCGDKGGGVHRSKQPGEAGAIVARGRPGSPIAAAPIAGTRVVYAFLDDRKTSEGSISQAFVALDDEPAVTLSEEGAGATFVTLAARGDEAVAVYMDARRVLTPVHARVVTAQGKLALGPDAVLFVGAGGDARTGAAISRGAPGSELALFATDKDDKAFGLAAIKIDEQPRDDARVTWSLYPAAMDRAAIAATQGHAPALVLRTVPSSAKSGADRVLELGELDASGAYKALCPVAEGPWIGDLAIAADRSGALWIAYTDGDGTWVERRGK